MLKKEEHTSALALSLSRAETPAVASMVILARSAFWSSKFSYTSKLGLAGFLARISLNSFLKLARIELQIEN